VKIKIVLTVLLSTFALSAIALPAVFVRGAYGHQYVPAADKPSPPSEVPQVLAAAQRGIQAYFSSLVLSPQAQVAYRTKRLTETDLSTARTSAERIIDASMTGKAAAIQRVAVSQGLAMILRHGLLGKGEPTSVVTRGGGVRDFKVESTVISGNSARVKARCVTWLITDAYYADGPMEEFKPVSAEKDVVSLVRGAHGAWKMSADDVDLASP
jgi:hypothetical protein